MTKKRKLNSKNPKYRTQAEVQATTKEVDNDVSSSNWRLGHT